MFQNRLVSGARKWRSFYLKYKTFLDDYKLFFISNSFISNARLKLAKNQANAKQHPQAELLLFGKYSHSSSMLSSKNNRKYSTNEKQDVCLFS